ncbi:LOW QUALITY PROTEIN: cytochrome P450 4F4-like [Amphiura filiformis]|uniref:LOW QUALITY PROTEIN: cytochrome P450 4F4-like n=1 Tax=Amphiura filiformis TaxID=82378 RepID=UPI003B225BBC
MAGDRQGFALIVTSFVVLTLVKLFAVLFSNIKKRWRYLKLTEEIENCAYKEPHILFGNIREIPRDDKDIIDDLLQRSQACVNTRYLWLGPFECIITPLNPEYVKVMIANADIKGNIFYKFVKPWLGDGLLLSSGRKWKRHRRLLTPAFHFDILRPYVKLSVKSSKVFLDRLAATNGEFIDIFKYASLMTLDTLLKCAFSYESNCQSNDSNPYIESVYAMSELFAERAVFLPYHYDAIYRFTPNGRRFYKHCQRVHTMAETTIKGRASRLGKLTENNEHGDEHDGENMRRKRKYLDFLDVLLQARDEDGDALEDLEIREEVDNFMFAGHDTTASAISWCLYNLARFPQFQKKCRDEVNDLFMTRNKEELDWDDRNQLPFLTMFIKESLRFHPPVPVYGRTLGNDVTLPDGVVLPKGTSVGVSVISVHHHHLYWNDPEVFDPYRFTPENNAKRHSHAFIPFSAGPRNCIGQNFAMNEIKVVVAMTVRRFEIISDPENPPQWTQSRVVLRSLNGIYLKFIPAKNEL